MKQVFNSNATFKKSLALVTLLFSQSLIWAQDKTVDVNLNVNKGGENDWYAQPWLLVLGGAVFIIIIVALLRGKK